jgi:MYXO-CTERM domain-containing protein
VCRASFIIGAALLAASAFAQQPATTQNPNPNAPTYNRPYNGPVVVRHGHGGSGLLGLLGLAGLLGLRRRATALRGRDVYLGEQPRRAA